LVADEEFAVAHLRTGFVGRGWAACGRGRSCGGSFCERVGQRPAVDLAVGVARQRSGAQFDLRRHHVGRHAAAAFGDQELALGDKETDAAGRVDFDLGLRNISAPTFTMNLLTEVFEADGGRSVTTSVQSLVSRQPYLIGLRSVDSLGYVKRGVRRELKRARAGPAAASRPGRKD
jgi:hypothetical protein